MLTLSTENTRPVAVIQPQADTLNIGSTVLLDGTLSYDDNLDLLNYQWFLLTQPLASQSVLNNPSQAQTSLVLDQSGTYQVELIVNDGALDSHPATVTFSTANTRPVADTGPSQSPLSGDLVTLDGSASTDADNDPLSHRWDLTVVPNNSSAALDNPQAINPQFIADLPGDYLAQLIVHDGALPSFPKTVHIRTNQAPEPVQDSASVSIGGTVSQLDSGAFSVLANDSDPDGDALSIDLASVQGPDHATSFELNSDGSFSYTHDGSDNNADIVSYDVCDNAPSPACVSTELC